MFRRVAANELDDGFQSEIMSIYSSRDIHEEISIMKGVIQQQLEALTGLNHHHMSLWDRQLQGYLTHLSGLQEEARHIDELVSCCLDEAASSFTDIWGSFPDQLTKTMNLKQIILTMDQNRKIMIFTVATVFFVSYTPPVASHTPMRILMSSLPL